ncbi:MAG: NADH-quinone oxidoreductase subunit H [Sulfuricella sp.]
MNTTTLLFQLFQNALVLLAAPLLLGWVNNCRAWMQGRSAAGIFQPYRNLAKLFHKDAVLANSASPLFRYTPYALFVSMWLAAAMVPVLAIDLPLSNAVDVIALVGIFALARVFIALAAMDIGTSFGTLGARREMLVSFLAEPALLMVFFSASMIAHSTSLTTIVETFAHKQFVIHPSLAFGGIAFLMVLLAENSRTPVDNPSTHLELTMIHEAMILEYSARHLALIEWASAMKLFAYVTIGIALFLPWGIAEAGNWGAVPLALVILALKLAAAGFGLALLESVSAKLRIFRAPEYLGTAFLLAVLGILTLNLLKV